MKKYKIIISVTLIASLILCLTLWQQSDTPVSNAEEHVISNPKVEDGISTWDCVYFGYYFQSGDTVKEPIKWRILSVDGDDAFLLADKNLAYHCYDSKEGEITWETCSLRTWLNEDFYNAVFQTELQKNAIKTANVVNENNPLFRTNGGKDTLDKIYVPSIGEMINPVYGFNEEYTESNTRLSNTTEYALNTSPTVENQDENEYWLRTPGYNTPGHFSTVVCTAIGIDGGLDLTGAYHNPTTINVYVRPCLHLDLSSSEWSYAGTVSSNGEENTLPSPTPIATAEPTPTPSPTPVPTPTPTSKPTATPPVIPTQTPDTSDNTPPAPTDSQNEQPAVSTPSKTVSAPGRPQKLAVKNNKTKTITVSWKKVKKANGYQVQYATNSAFSKKKVKNTKKTKLVIRKLKKKKTYCFRVRAYKTTNGAKKYGKWSKVKKIKIKK